MEVSGPGGVKAVLRIDAADDHAKDSHQCEAVYRLLLTGSAAYGTVFYSSDAEWGRRLVAHLDGFSQDGAHVFGVIAEGGAHSSALVFAFSTAKGSAQVIAIRKPQAVLRSAKCGESFAIAGTVEDGLVLEPNTANGCRARHRWVLDNEGNLRPMPLDKSYAPLFRKAP